MPTAASTYPQVIDSFTEYTETDSPNNLVRADIVNKLGSAISKIENRLLGSVKSLYSTGPIFYTISKQVTVPQDIHNNLFNVLLEIESSVSDSLFNSMPFIATNGLVASARGYRLVSNTRRYHRVDCGIAPVIGNNERSITVVCLRSDGEWFHGDIIDVQLLIIKPS